MVDDIDIEKAEGDKEDGPGAVEGEPDLCGESELRAEHALDQRLLADIEAAEESNAEEPVDDGGLPLDEHLILQQQRRAAEEADQNQGDDVRLLEFPLHDPVAEGLNNACDNQHHSSDIDILHLVGDEEKENRKEVE